MRRREAIALFFCAAGRAALDRRRSTRRPSAAGRGCDPRWLISFERRGTPRGADYRKVSELNSLYEMPRAI
jgi:hypothetical protein